MMISVEGREAAEGIRACERLPCRHSYLVNLYLKKLLFINEKI